MLTGKTAQDPSQRQRWRWLVRHGESTANAGVATTDPATIPLTLAGRGQAQQVATALPQRPDLIVVSPYLRTQQTAEPTMRRFPNVPVETWPVQEFTYLASGRCIDTTAEQRLPLVQAYWDRCDAGHADGEGAESFSAMLGRVRDLQHRLATHPAGCIVVFTHGQVMQALRLLDMHPAAGERELMARFLEFDRQSPVRNGQVLAA